MVLSYFRLVPDDLPSNVSSASTSGIVLIKIHKTTRVLFTAELFHTLLESSYEVGQQEKVMDKADCNLRRMKEVELA